MDSDLRMLVGSGDKRSKKEQLLDIIVFNSIADILFDNFVLPLQTIGPKSFLFLKDGIPYHSAAYQWRVVKHILSQPWIAELFSLD